MRLKEAIWSLLGQSMETILKKKLFIIGSLKILSLEYSIIILIKKNHTHPYSTSSTVRPVWDAN
jgi:hypothetical protein